MRMAAGWAPVYEGDEADDVMGRASEAGEEMPERRCVATLKGEGMRRKSTTMRDTVGLVRHRTKRATARLLSRLNEAASRQP